MKGNKVKEGNRHYWKKGGETHITEKMTTFFQILEGSEEVSHAFQ